MKIKLLALDIDGTLTNHAGEISEKNRLAVRRAIDSGVHVVLATGRGRIASRPVWRTLDLHGPSINYGGAMIADIDTERALVLHELPPDVIRETLDFSAKIDIPAQICLDEAVISERPSDAARGYVNRHKLRYIIDPDIRNKTFHNVPKLLAFVPLDRAEELFAAYKARLDGIAQVSRSSPGFIEINSLGITKATALEELSAMLHVSRAETAAMGDNFLDIEMIEWAGVGVSVSDGEPEAIAASDLIAPSSDEDAVAWYIEQHIL